MAHDDSGPPRQKTLSALVASPGIADNPVVQAIYTQLVTYQATLDSISVGKWGSSPNNPDVQRLHALVAGGQSQLGDAVGSQITSLDARVAALDELRQRSTDALKTLPATQAGEARLMEQVESARNMADELRDEYQKARIAEAVEAGQVEVVDLATSPYAPIGTSRRTKLLTGIIVGLLLGTGAAFLVERLNTAIRRREEIESMLQIPGLAIIPQIASQNGVRRLKMGNMSLRLPTPRGNWGVGNGTSNEESLVTVSDFRSSSAEAFRTLRTNLIFSQAVQSLRTIVITSPSPQDGKTTTAANLAVTFAQQGMRVLIVDCDLRRARLHKLFRAPREPGLTQFMMGQATQEQVIQSTMVDNLWFLPAGAHPPNPSELLGGTQNARDAREAGPRVRHPHSRYAPGPRGGRRAHPRFPIGRRDSRAPGRTHRPAGGPQCGATTGGRRRPCGRRGAQRSGPQGAAVRRLLLLRLLRQRGSVNARRASAVQLHHVPPPLSPPMRAFFLALLFCATAALPAVAQTAPPPADTNTVLHPGDEVRLTVWRNPELSGDFVIGINGALIHPLYQAVPIIGVPMQEVVNRIRNFLKTYQSDPQIVVMPLLHVTVAGEVGKPSLYNLPRGTSIGEAIALAGGPSAEGNIKKVSLFRDNRETKIDLQSPLNAWASAPVQSGDAIIVSHRGSFFRDVFVPLLTLTGTVASIVNLVRR